MFRITSKIKFLGNTFFIWSIPFTIFILNIINQREVLNINLLLGIVLGIFINIIWKMMFLFLESNKIKMHHRKFYKMI
ncbi:MAG: hypothetical protein ACNI25_05535 [Halarcobacter sp.]